MCRFSYYSLTLNFILTSFIATYKYIKMKCHHTASFQLYLLPNLAEYIDLTHVFFLINPIPKNCYMNLNY